MTGVHHPFCARLRAMPGCDCWARAAVERTAHDLGGYGVANQTQILAGDYSAVALEDREHFERAIAAARALGDVDEQASPTARERLLEPTHKVTITLYVSDEREAERWMNWIADGLEPFDRDSLLVAGVASEPAPGPHYGQVAT